MKKKYLLFDLDGTLMDSRKSLIKATYYVSEKYAPGRYTYPQTVARFGEDTRYFLSTLSNNPKDVEKDYSDYISTLTSFPFNGISKYLKKLKSKGYLLAIVTNKQRDLAIGDLEKNRLFELFEAVVSVDDVKKAKPAKDMIVKAMNILGANPLDTVLIGDSLFDQKAAENAGIDFIMMDWYREFDRSEFDSYTTCISQVESIISFKGGCLNVG